MSSRTVEVVGVIETRKMDIENNAGNEQQTSTILDCPKKCCYKLAIQATFNIVLLSGLSLMTAGVFKEQVSYEESESGKLQFTLNLKALLGLLMVLYSLIGICLNCLNRLNCKVGIQLVFILRHLASK